MAKYNKFQQKPEKKAGMNPVWRGIGCLLIVIIPLLGYGLMKLLLPPIIASPYAPTDIMGFVQFDEWVYKAPALGPISLFIHGIPDFG